ncbi:lipase 3-like [Aphidius gifuensis]|uniref:lipase 3-like n=1 Tax=Aphidius gifuensis TaxID=684658 RepID=UPI001CDD76F1|nr:lipase 3-like [Aphidius gifuensis]
MKKLISTIILFCAFKFVMLEEIPDLLRVRKAEDAEGVEFFALDTIGLIEKWGYPAEQHNVTTKDGYNLNMFRIPSSPNATKKNNKVVFIQIGMLGTSDVCVYFGPNRSLALQLADEGYDVWLGNYRGSTYGRSHVKLSPDDGEFWNFSFHEIGMEDLPCMIDYVLNVTNKKSLILVCQSMATSATLVLLSEQPEYNKKIDLVVMLSPVSAMYYKLPIRNFFMILVKIWQQLLEPYDTLFELFRQSSVVPAFFKRVCIPNDIIDLCFLLPDIVVGKDREQLEMEHLVDFMCYSPSGASSKLFWHYRQLEEYSKFSPYDYEDVDKNIKHYGQSVPPEYNLKNVKVPMLFYYAPRVDLLSMEKDVLELAKRVTSDVISEPIKWDNFNHLDFATAKDVKTLVNDLVIEQFIMYINHQ